jgi:hypothetical protein
MKPESTSCFAEKRVHGFPAVGEKIIRAKARCMFTTDQVPSLHKTDRKQPIVQIQKTAKRCRYFIHAIFSKVLADEVFVSVETESKISVVII